MRRLGVLAIVLVLVGCSGGNDRDNAAENGTESDEAASASLECEWPMWGHNPQRPFAYPASCDSEIAPDTVARLHEAWFFETPDVVTATPAVVDGVAYVGDWSGTFHAIDVETGEQRWDYRVAPHPNVWSGQIVSSAAVADVAGQRLVYFAAGKTMHALDTDGELVWEHELNPDGAADDPTEIQSSPVVVDTADGPTIIFGFDGHDAPGVRAGLLALDAKTGDERWYFDPDQGAEPSGCVGIWGSPTVDSERRLVFAGTANCPSSPEGWNDYSESIFAVDLDTGAPRWHFQPRGPNNLDFDFAGAPNLFEVDGRVLVGLGGKDGVYYALDRETGELVWSVEASAPRVQGHNFSTGGFIGAAAYSDGVVVGGTALDGPCPCLHGIDTTTGALAWQQNAASATFASSAIVNGVAFSGSTIDFTLRALDMRTGDVLWAHEMVGAVAGGVAIVDDWVVAVAGIREPGLEPAGTEAGVSGFTLGDQSATTTTGAATTKTLPPTPTAPPEDPSFRAPGPGPQCIGSACTVPFTLVAPPAGTNPEVVLRLTPDPFRVEVRASDLGDPAAWLRPGSVQAQDGAVAYGVFVSDDSLSGALLCVLDANFDCVNETRPADATSVYNRVTILAIVDSPVLPSPADGANRIVTTIGLDEPVEFP